VISPDAALIVALGDTPLAGKTQPSIERRSIQTLTAVRRDGEWRLTSFQYTRRRMIAGTARAALLWLFTDLLWRIIGPREAMR
jgi:hypothetical protein